MSKQKFELKLLLPPGHEGYEKQRIAEAVAIHQINDAEIQWLDPDAGMQRVMIRGWVKSFKRPYARKASRQ